jgi:Bacterial protein of unknown function (DUF899)
MRKSATSLGAARLLLHVAHRPTAEAQCEGCTFYTSQVREVPYLHSRDVTYATSCQGPYDESVRYRVFMDWDEPWYSVQTPPRLCWPDAGSARCTWFATCGTATGVFETYWTTLRGVEAMDDGYALFEVAAADALVVRALAERGVDDVQGMQIGQLSDLARVERAALALSLGGLAGVPHEGVGDQT